MRRTIANLVTAAALLVVVTLLVAAVTSFWVYPYLILTDAAKTSYLATVVRGELAFNLQYSAYYPDDSKGIFFAARPIPRNEAPFPSETFLNRRGFWTDARTQNTFNRKPPPNGWHAPAWFGLLGLVHDQPVSSLSIGVPIWLPIVLASLLPARLISRFMRHRNRLIAHCCTTCGYDLRATPDRCPECGAIPKPAPRATA